MAVSAIEWTDKTWNPTVGCREISPGCKHCYAAVMHARLTKMGQKKYADPFHVVKPWAPNLGEPLKWKKPARIFVNSMSDLFHEDVPDEYIAAVFGVMAACPQHTFQVLTKRAERLPQWNEWLQREALSCNNGRGMSPAARCFVEAQRHSESPLLRRDTHVPCEQQWPLPNVWLGVSVEDQPRADERIPHLLRVPAAVRFLSVEPMIGPVDLAQWLPPLGAHVTGRPDQARIDWCIVGGESGHGARPFNLDWARSIVRQCAAANVPVFVKQLGAVPLPGKQPNGTIPDLDGRRMWQYVNGLEQRIAIDFASKKGGDIDEWPADLRVRQFPRGK